MRDKIVSFEYPTRRKLLGGALLFLLLNFWDSFLTLQGHALGAEELSPWYQQVLDERLIVIKLLLSFAALAFLVRLRKTNVLQLLNGVFALIVLWNSATLLLLHFLG